MGRNIFPVLHWDTGTQEQGGGEEDPGLGLDWDMLVLGVVTGTG